MKISKLAQVTDIPAKTIRYYEEVGLTPAPQREENGYRYYTDRDVERLVFIRRCRELRISLEQIRKLVAVQGDKSASCQEVDRIIEEQLGKVRKAQAELAMLEKSLSTLSESCQSNEVRECEILNRLKNP